MKVEEKYTNTKEKDKIENKEKIVLSNSEYALIETIERLSDEIMRARLK